MVRPLFLLMLLSACPTTTGPASPKGQGSIDASAYESCDSLCVHPGDCRITYNDDGICPVGFRCTLRFTCSPSPSPSP